MSIIRVNKRQGFFTASNEPFNDKRLSWESRGVMGYLLSKPDGWECHNYDLVNQTKAGKHVVQRILKELQEIGYMRRYRVSSGRGQIEWVTEIYESPQDNTVLRSTNISNVENYEDVKYEDVKPGDIVNTNFNKNLLSEKTKKESSATADFSKPVSLLSEKEIKALKIPLPEWKQHLEDELAERNRKGVVKFLERKVSTGPLWPDTPESELLFEKIAIECKAAGHRPPDKFPSLATKNKYDQAAAKFNGTLEQVLEKAIHARGKGIVQITDYISSPKWHGHGGKNEQRRAGSPGSRQQSLNGGASSGPPAGSGQTSEMRAKLKAHFGGG